MALQVPFLSLGSAASEVWPSVRKTVATPWRVLSTPPGRQDPLNAARTKSTISFSKAQTASIGSPSLPDFLQSTSVRSLRLSASHTLLGASPRPHGFSTVGLSSANLFSRSRQITPTSRSPQSSPLRFFSNFSTPKPLQQTAARRSVRYDFGQRRTLFGASSSQNLLAHMEQTANNNPNSATAQNAFYSALLRADMPAIVVERYQTGRYASSSACETTYRRALERIAQADPSSIALAGRNQPATGLSTEQLQALGQAVAAQTKGGQVAGAKVGSTGTGEKANPLYVVVEESTGANIFKWVKFVLYLAVFGYLAMIMVTLAVEFSGILRKVGGSPVNEAQPQNQAVKFSDVHGCEEAKEELQELVEFLKNPEKFSSLGGRLPKGVLLTGPPGTGKTLLARAVAGEAGVPFFFASGSEFDEMYVGVGAKRIRELFGSARAKAPAIIFIDELDAIGSKRVDRDPAYVKQSLNQLLTELDGFSKDTGVIIIAATNLPNLLDKALTRPGRFDRNVSVPLPDVRGRLAILKHHMKNVQVATDVDESVIARGTTGFSGADLENLINQAAVRASRNKATKVSMAELEWSKDKIVMGAERRSAVIPEKEKLMTAYHEAGHTLVSLHTVGAMPFYKVTIMPRGYALGVTHFMPEMDRYSERKMEMLAQIDVAMGGKVAEEIVYGDDNVTSGCSHDLQGATKTAFNMITRNGMSPTLGNMDFFSDYNRLSADTKLKIESEVRGIVDEAHKRAAKILTTHRKDLDTLAKALVDYETLSKEEVQKVLKGEKLRTLTVSPGTGIKLPELNLPPGLAGPQSTPVAGESAQSGGSVSSTSGSSGSTPS